MSGRLPITLAVLVFIPVACFEKECGPDEVECESDQNCPAGTACREESGGCDESGARCVPVNECDSDADCMGEPCVQREPDPAEHPFERSVGARGICGCDGGGGCEPFMTTSTSGAGGSGGGFDPGTTVTVGPSSSQSGTGGATASSSSGGGASGAGGATSTSTGGGGASSGGGSGGQPSSSSSGAGGAGGSP